MCIVSGSVLQGCRLKGTALVDSAGGRRRSTGRGGRRLRQHGAHRQRGAARCRRRRCVWAAGCLACGLFAGRPVVIQAAHVGHGGRHDQGRWHGEAWLRQVEWGGMAKAGGMGGMAKAGGMARQS
eukprot:194740-Chlamydomonas_euryale.AAC.1